MRSSPPVEEPGRRDEVILRCRSLTKRYGSKVVVDALDFSLERGRIYGLIGRNGAGKTTVMRMICGLVAPTAGDVVLFGRSSRHRGRQRQENLRRLGCLNDDPALQPQPA